MKLTILSVAYPLAVAAPGAVGGAEQVLLSLDQALTRRGHNSLVLAQEGSKPSGELLPLPAVPPPFDDIAVARARERLKGAIDRVVATRPVDIVHLHGVDFWTYLPRPGRPVLATLHLPASFYPREALIHRRPETWIHAVSAGQHATLPPLPGLLPPVENGIDLAAFGGPYRRRNFALFLGRICPEKGPHLAIAAARRAGIPLLIAGEVQPYADHVAYFRDEIEPHLGRACRFVGPVGPAARRRLLASARCLLVPSLVAETSSLAAREAAASGTPVVARPEGALADIIIDGETGFLAENIEAMAEAIRKAERIEPARCRAEAERRFSLDGMVSGYLDLYASVLGLRQRRESAR